MSGDAASRGKEVSRLKQQLAELEGEAAAAASDLTAASRKLEGTEQELQAVRADLRARNAEVAELQQQLEASLATADALQSEKRELRGRLAEGDEEVQRLESTVGATSAASTGCWLTVTGVTVTALLFSRLLSKVIAVTELSCMHHKLEAFAGRHAALMSDCPVGSTGPTGIWCACCRLKSSTAGSALWTGRRQPTRRQRCVLLHHTTLAEASTQRTHLLLMCAVLCLAAAASHVSIHCTQS